jgi:hypothetical protein
MMDCRLQDKREVLCEIVSVTIFRHKPHMDCPGVELGPPC